MKLREILASDMNKCFEIIYEDVQYGFNVNLGRKRLQWDTSMTRQGKGSDDPSIDSTGSDDPVMDAALNSQRRQSKRLLRKKSNKWSGGASLLQFLPKGSKMTYNKKKKVR